MNRIDELATYTSTSDGWAPREMVANNEFIIARKAVDLICRDENLYLRNVSGGLACYQMSVEVVGGGWGAGDGESANTLGFDRNHIVLVLQDSFHHQELFRRE